MDWETLRQQLAKPHTHPSEAERVEWAGQVAQWALRHFQTLPEQRIGQYVERAVLEPMLHEAAPEQGQPFTHVLGEFQSKITPNAFRTSHPRFLAFVPGAPSFPSVLGDWLCAASNFFCGVWLEASGPTQVEVTVLEWFKSLLGYPAEARGILTSGGSEANLTALVVARNRLPFADRSRAVLYVSEQRHWSVDRAANVIGLYPSQIRPVPADSQHRLTVAALASGVELDRQAGRLPWAVVANAGATNTGTVDPLRPLAQFCQAKGLWFHVDAAYGWSAALIPEGKAALDGIAEADSITFDPHKWFGQTFDAGGLFVRHGRLLPETFALRPDYMQDVAPEEEEVNFCDHGLALTRRFRALKIWLSVKVLGLAWFRQLVERCFRLADFAQQTLEQAGDFEIICPRQLSIICFRYRPHDWRGSDDDLDRLNLQLLEELRKSGRAFLSSTKLDGRVVVRMCFINWRTTSGDVEEIVALLREIGKRLT
ncbi:MAG TPA: aminotransferase class V-fold PLP-dependent enzyme [Gemmataceae bacterium]|jgi:glutamate/tyrosine decarboxylase-like PLP-dependent enzyme|nr:aminotransferase class V-fold PLP-dependent enzyme [Gemmataceae bacterium]